MNSSTESLRFPPAQVSFFPLPLCTSQSPLTEDTVLLTTTAMCHYTVWKLASLQAAFWEEATQLYQRWTCLVNQQITTFIQSSHHKAGSADAQINTRSVPDQALIHTAVRHKSQVLQASKLQVSEIQKVENWSLLAKSGAMDFLPMLARSHISLKSPFTATCLGVGTC